MNKSKLTKPYFLIPIAVLCCFLWGSAFPFVKVGYKLFDIQPNDYFSQIVFGGMRFVISGILVILVGSLTQKRFLKPKNKKTVGYSFILALIQTAVQHALFYVGIAHTSGVKSSVLVSLNVFCVLLVSTLIFRLEKLNSQKIIGTVLGFLGVVLINLGPGGFGNGFTLEGEGVILLSDIAYAFSNVLIKKYSKYENPVTLSGYQFFIGGIIMILFGYIAGGRVTNISGFGGILTLVYLGFVSAVSYTVWGILLKHNPVSKVSVIGFMIPVFGVLLSALILGETKEAFNVKSLISLLLVSVGIYIVNANFKRKNKLA